MLFNNVEINIFDQLYAVDKIKNTCNVYDHRELYKTITLFPDDTNYNEGDICHEDNGSWYNYPDNIAIIIESNNRIMLQLYSNKRVGKLYQSIEDNEKEIREFFEKNRGNIALLENGPSAGKITPTYESLILYIEKFKALEEQKAEFHMLFSQFRIINYDMERYKEASEEYFLGEEFGFIMNTSKTVLEHLRKLRGAFQEMKEEKMDDITIPTTYDEAIGIVFSLLYFNYENAKKENGFSLSRLKTKLNQFITKYPNAIDCFCTLTKKDKIEKKRLMASLKKDKLTEPFIFSVADEILGSDGL